VAEELTGTGQSCSRSWKIAFYVLLTFVLTVIIGVFFVYQTLFTSAFTPVTLSQSEQQRLERKLERFDSVATGQGQLGRRSTTITAEALTPVPYSEVGASRAINLSEKELNALLANNTDLAQRLVIDLSSNLASARLLIPLDPDFPIMGGKTVKLNAGLELDFANGRPIVVLRGVSVWGVPLPAAWLGGLKNVDLVQEFGQSHGFWQGIADGVERIAVEEGQLHIVLKE